MSDELQTLADELEDVWRRSDALFEGVQPEALLARPVPQRHPFVYYLGHLPAFAWEHVCRALLGRGASGRPEFDDLFARRDNPEPGADDPERVACHDWPRPEEVRAWRDDVRGAVRGAVDEIRALGDTHVMSSRGRVLHAVIEHEALHHETLLHLTARLDGALKRPPATRPAPSFAQAVQPRQVLVTAGRVTLGADPDAQPFGWDHEFPAEVVDVPAFRMDRTPVMTGEFFEFVDAGGYRDPSWWTAEDWRWREAAGLEHPVGWRREGAQWVHRGVLEDLPLTRVFDWPVYVSQAEAQAFLAWRGRRLPTEAEFLRAAYGSPDGEERRHPWGDAPPEPRHGNFDWTAWSPAPVGSHPDGASAFGLLELVGNGWEWTCSTLAPREGFRESMPDLGHVSIEAFEAEPVVRLGASWATPRRLLRRSYRRWSSRHDPYVFAKFRGVAPAEEQRS